MRVVQPVVYRPHVAQKRRERRRGRGTHGEHAEHAEQGSSRGEFHGMQFDFLDGYLLNGVPSKAQVVKKLLSEPADVAGASAFYQGIRMLGPKTPDLALIALRLVLAGKTADDASVVRVREIIDRARAKGSDSQGALTDYRKELS
jgi:hypothetical protein